jgi:hypothetical protein
MKFFVLLNDAALSQPALWTLESNNGSDEVTANNFLLPTHFYIKNFFPQNSGGASHGSTDETLFLLHHYLSTTPPLYLQHKGPATLVKSFALHLHAEQPSWFVPLSGFKSPCTIVNFGL